MTNASFPGSEIVKLLPDRLKLNAGEISSKDFAEPKSITGQALGFVRTMATEEIKSALALEETGLDILDTISGVWARAIVLAEFANEEIHPRDVTEIVHLTEHTMPLTADLIVTIRIAGVGETEVPLLLEVTLGLKSVALSIRSGKIIAVSFGEATAIVALSAGGVQLHRDMTEKNIQLGPTKHFAQGVSIGSGR